MFTHLSERFKLFFNFNGRHEMTTVNQLQGGLTNKSYLVRTTSNEYVARIPGEGIGETIDREIEAFNTRVAYQAGVTAEVVYDEENGNKVTRFLKNPDMMSSEKLKQPENIALSGAVLRKLHSSKELFKNTVNVFDINRGILSKLQAAGCELSESYLRVARQIDQIENQLKFSSFDLTPCHNDTTSTNFIISEGVMYLIDFEYSGNNDPMWDLACFSSEAAFTEEQDNSLFNAYYADQPSNAEAMQRFQLYKPVVGFWVTLWCLTQLQTITTEEDKQPIRELLDKHFSNCQRLLDKMQIEIAPSFQPKFG